MIFIGSKGLRMQFQKERFSNVRFEDTQSFEGYEFIECEFDGCVIEPRAQLRCLSLDERVVFNDCKLVNCKDNSCLIGPAIFRRCLLDGLETAESGARIDGALLEQVTIKGNIGTIRLLAGATGGIDQAFDNELSEANKQLYTEVEWAVDISQAFPTELALYGIPPALIRHDPQRQAIVRRENVEQNYADAIAVCGETHFRICIDNLKFFPTADNVCFSAPSNGDEEVYKTVITELRKRGFADSPN